MTPRPIALEAFHAARKADPAPEADITVEVDASAAETQPDQPEAEPEIVADPDAERRECLMGIAQALGSAARDQTAQRARWIADAAAAFGAAAESVLPAMARAGLGGLVAEAVEKLALEARPPRLEVHIAPADAVEIGKALSFVAATGIEIRRDETMTPGQVRLEWESGGARIDAEAIAAAALDLFRRTLAAKRSMEPEQ